MTTKREVPLVNDTLAWVHSELAEIKSRLALVQQAAEQSRGLATEAADVSHEVRRKIDQFDGQPAVVEHLQDDLRALRDHLARAQDDIHSLRQSREEIERHVLAEAERVRQDKNEASRRLGEVERLVETWQERLAGYEEHSRRGLEAASQLAMRLEAIEGNQSEIDTLHSRGQATLSRLDQEVQRLAGAMSALQREDDVQRERSNSAFEMLRRLEAELENIRAETNRISRIDDRVELVQAERTRHNERLNEISADLAKIDSRLNEHSERGALLDVRMANHQEELRHLRERLQMDRETIAAYLHSLSELEAETRKRQIIALEKEIRDVRGRALDFTED